jgi:hypothetical protein
METILIMFAFGIIFTGAAAVMISTGKRKKEKSNMDEFEEALKKAFVDYVCCSAWEELLEDQCNVCADDKVIHLESREARREGHLTCLRHSCGFVL